MGIHLTPGNSMSLIGVWPGLLQRHSAELEGLHAMCLPIFHHMQESPAVYVNTTEPFVHSSMQHIPTEFHANLKANPGTVQGTRSNLQSLSPSSTLPLTALEKNKFWVVTNVSGCPADAMNALVQRVNREAETDAIELATIQWLQLLPSLIQACAEISHSSAFLFDIFQVSCMTA